MKFRDDVLVNYTDTQIIAAIDWCMNGMEPDLEVKTEKDVTEVPDDNNKGVSIAKQLLIEALGEGMSGEVADYALLPDLKKMVLVAAMNKGADITKNEHTKNAGKFYVACGRIHKRLMEEKTNG